MLDFQLQFLNKNKVQFWALHYTPFYSLRKSDQLFVKGLSTGDQ